MMTTPNKEFVLRKLLQVQTVGHSFELVLIDCNKSYYSRQHKFDGAYHCGIVSHFEVVALVSILN